MVISRTHYQHGQPHIFRFEGTHKAEVLQSLSTKDEAKAACGYITIGSYFPHCYQHCHRL